jgi:hypothetical protein
MTFCSQQDVTQFNIFLLFLLTTRRGSTGSQTRFAARDRPRRKKTHERSDEVTDTHTKKEAMVGEVPSLPVTENMLNDECGRNQ